MAFTNEPDDYEVIGAGAVWGTHILEDTGGQNLIGAQSIKCTGNAPTGNFGLRRDIIPVQEGRPYMVTALLKANSVAAGMNVWAYVEWYNRFGALLSTNYVLNGVPLNVVNTWEERRGLFTAPVNARFAKVAFLKDHVNIFDLFCDHIGIQRAPVAFSAYRNAARSVNDTTWTDLLCETEEYDYGSAYGTGTGRFIAPYDGLFQFNARSQVSSLADGDFVVVGLFKNGVEYKTGSINAIGVALSPAAVASASMWLVYGDYVEAMVQHNFGAPRNLIVGTTYSTWFNGHEISLLA